MFAQETEKGNGSLILQLTPLIIPTEVRLAALMPLLKGGFGGHEGTRGILQRPGSISHLTVSL